MPKKNIDALLAELELGQKERIASIFRRGCCETVARLRVFARATRHYPAMNR